MEDDLDEKTASKDTNSSEQTAHSPFASCSKSNIAKKHTKTVKKLPERSQFEMSRPNKFIECWSPMQLKY